MKLPTRDVTIRDLFALAALPGVLAGPWDVQQTNHVARTVYEIADALVHERTKQRRDGNGKEKE